MRYISWWSILNAILLGTILVPAFHVMICKKKCSFKGGILSYVILLMLIFFRVFIPVDIGPAMVIPSKRIYTVINNALNSSICSRISIVAVIIAIWMGGVLISCLKWIRQVRITRVNIHLIKGMAGRFPEKYRDIALSAGIVPERILFSEHIDEVVTVGAFDYYVLLPAMDYSENDICNILRHEAEHIHHKDILVKMVLHIASCLLWWNPLIVLFEYDYSMLSEYRCDDNAVKNYSDSEKISYVETLKKMAVIKNSAFYECNAAGFAIASKKTTLVSRADRVLSNRGYSSRSELLVMIGMILFLFSYTVQVQPSYDVVPVDNEIEITPDNAYIRNIDNEYILYIGDDPIEDVEENKLSDKPYIGLEIRK